MEASDWPRSPSTIPPLAAADDPVRDAAQAIFETLRIHGAQLDRLGRPTRQCVTCGSIKGFSIAGHQARVANSWLVSLRLLRDATGAAHHRSSHPAS